MGRAGTPLGPMLLLQLALFCRLGFAKISKYYSLTLLVCSMFGLVRRMSANRQITMSPHHTAIYSKHKAGNLGLEGVVDTERFFFMV